SEAQLVEARTRAEVQRIDAQARNEARRLESEAQAEAQRIAAEADAETQRVKTEAEIRDLRQREQAAEAFTRYPALLRLLELESLRDLGRSANARIYVSFDRSTTPSDDKEA
ncbi:MAG: slipin family protein, partial [Anaerolineae bacterium]|nr:slipin family protein [Anaerolineae bacterium]